MYALLSESLAKALPIDTFRANSLSPGVYKVNNRRLVRFCDRGFNARV